MTDGQIPEAVKSERWRLEKECEIDEAEQAEPTRETDKKMKTFLCLVVRFGLV